MKNRSHLVVSSCFFQLTWLSDCVKSVRRSAHGLSLLHGTAGEEVAMQASWLRHTYAQLQL